MIGRNVNYNINQIIVSILLVFHLYIHIYAQVSTFNRREIEITRQSSDFNYDY